MNIKKILKIILCILSVLIIITSTLSHKAFFNNKAITSYKLSSIGIFMITLPFVSKIIYLMIIVLNI